MEAPMDAVAMVRVTGPLTRYVEGFAAELRSHGYTELSIRNLLHLMSDLSRWLQSQRLPVKSFDHAAMRRFLARHRRMYTHFRSERALGPLLAHLHAAGAMAAIVVAEKPRSELLREYDQYLVEERGVTAAVRERYLAVAAEFLPRRDVASLTTRDVARHVSAHAGLCWFEGWLSALRSVLRFLFVASKTKTNLVFAVPSSPRWSQTSLPQSLEPQELAAVLSSPDRRTITGSRDYAVLILLSRLGLRACEVAAMQIEDIDWPLGEIKIRGKGKSLARLPLPVDVGEAVVAWLQRAQRSKTTRSVFVRVRAPYGPLTSPAVARIATTALRAAGIDRGGAHRLRHTAATQMLRRGASMTEIAQVLRHRHLNTTAIYAKVDHVSLRTIAKPWPVDHQSIDLIRELAAPWPGGVA
jgi:site-specific recombinase XerD